MTIKQPPTDDRPSATRAAGEDVDEQEAASDSDEPALPAEVTVAHADQPDSDHELAALQDALVAASAPQPDGRLAEVIAEHRTGLIREWCKHELFRWFAATGRVPIPSDWENRPGRPQMAEIVELYGGWQQMVEESGIEQLEPVKLLPRLGLILAEQRRTMLGARQGARTRERELAEREERLDVRARTIQADLEEATRERVLAAESAAAAAHEAQHEAEQAAAAAEDRAVEADLRAAEHQEDKERVARRAQALTHNLADATATPAPAFVAWFQFTGQRQFEVLREAAARALADGQLYDQILAARRGKSQLPHREGFIEVIRKPNALSLTHSEPLADAGSVTNPLAAHRRATLTIWQADEHHAGALTEVSYIDAEPALNRAGPDLARIAQQLTEAAAPDADGGWPIGQTASIMYEEGIDELLGFLASPNRTRPVVVLTSDDQNRTIVDPDQLAAELCGAAHVVALHPEATFALTERVGRTLNVFGGAACCYYPGFNTNAPRGKHPLVFQRPGEDPSAAHNGLLLLAGAPAVAASKLRESRAQGQGSSSPNGPPDTAGQRIAALTAQVSDLEEALRDQERERDQLADALATGRAPNDEESPEPRDVVEATRRARRDARFLTFAPKAFTTAAASPFRRPREIYDQLMALDQLAGEYIAETLGKGLGERAAELGLEWRADVSESARSSHPDAYSCIIDERTLDLGPHLVVANGTGAGLNARIYFHVCPGHHDLPRGIYVGHVGRHLPDSTT